MAETSVFSKTPAREGKVDVAALLKAIKDREAKIGVVGLGYVGIPLALTGTGAGFKIIGFDIDEPRVGQINRGESFIKHIPSSAIGTAVKSGRFEATSDFSRLSEPDAILICVPTPLTKYREPDLTYVVETAKSIGSPPAGRDNWSCSNRRPIRARRRRS